MSMPQDAAADIVVVISQEKQASGELLCLQVAAGSEVVALHYQGF